jgi:hypothetical protein
MAGTSLRSLIDGLRRAGARFGALPSLARGAAALSALWLVLVLSYAVGFFSGLGEGQPRGTVFLDGVFFLIALVLPLILIWLAAWLAMELARQRAAVDRLVDAAEPLIVALERARTTLAPQDPLSAHQVHAAVEAGLQKFQRDLGASLTAPILELRNGQARLEKALAAAVAGAATASPAEPPPAAAPGRTEPAAEPAARPERQPPPPDSARARRAAESEGADRQPDLPLIPAGPDPADRPTWPDLVRALDFPRDADDREGFDALRRVLRHHSLAQMLQAAEDVLNLLSQEGVYMDDLEHVRADPEDWRSFIAGRRGSEVAGVGGITDERALDVARGLMRSDPIFRDTSLFFQRRFDVVLGEYVREASDGQLLQIADTRSGRAFMLCARVSGSFE